jgi:hypothetical protein
MRTAQRIPFGITEYIRDHFKDDFLFELKDVREVSGRPVYTVEVSKDDYIHSLKFNEDGTLLKEEAKEAFPPDSHEGQAFGEVPE